MSSLKKTDPVPAVIVRLFDSVPCESIGESLVKVTSPASAAPVVMSTELLSVTAPLIRTSSPVVSTVSVSPTPGPPLKMMLVSSVEAAPRLIAPARLSVVTGAVPESAPPALAPPKVRLAVESSTVRVPGRPLAAVPMSALKVMSPAPARKTRSLASAACESIVATSEKKMSPAAVRFVPAPPNPFVVIVRSELIVTAPLRRTFWPSVAMVSVSAAFDPALNVMPVPPI